MTDNTLSTGPQLQPAQKKPSNRPLWIHDLLDGMSQWRLFTTLAVEDLRLRYHRTLLGPIWIVTAFVLFIIVKIYIFSALSSTTWQYFASYLTLGYLVWMFLNAGYIDGAACFVQSRGWILGTKCNYSVFVLQALIRTLLTTFVSATAALLIAYYLYPFPLINFVYAMGGFMIVVFMTFWVQLFLATVSVFARDMIPLVQTFMRIMFFLTPIIWVPSSLGSRAFIADYIPFTHLLAIVRNPLLSEPVSTLNWIVVASLTVTAIVLALLAFAWGRRRIPSYI